MRLARLAVALVIFASVAFALAEQRPFTVRDSIEMSTFSDPPRRSSNLAPKISPDNKYSVVITSRGLIESNEIESTVWLFNSRQILSSLRLGGHITPVALAKITAIPVIPASDSYEPVISELTWAPDSASIYFLNADSYGNRHLSRVNIKTRFVEQLTTSARNVERYTVLDDVIVYTATQRKSPVNIYDQVTARATPPASVSITGLPIESLLFPGAMANLIPQHHELWVIKNGRSTQVPDGPDGEHSDLAHYWDVLSISPDRKNVVQLRSVRAIPASWDSYLPMKGLENWKIKHDDPHTTSPDNRTRPRQYVLINLVNGRAIPLIGAPYGETLGHFEATQAVWAKSGRRLLLTNTFLPLEKSDRSEQSERFHPCAVAALEIPSREVGCIVYSRNAQIATAENPLPLRLEDASFGGSESEVVLHLDWWQDGRSVTEWYRLIDGQWQLVKAIPDGADRNGHNIVTTSGVATSVSLSVRQSLNERPTLWASDNLTGTSRMIWDPNPQLEKLALGEASVYHWIDSSGYEWTGGLVKPPGYVPGQRYPLIIQTHGFSKDEFLIDAEFTTGMAARPLAACGFVVLQVATNYTHTMQMKEAADNILGYESAIDQLASSGLIDPQRVGIIGFSRTSWYVESALVKDSERYAAASINDGIDHSYLQELLFYFDQSASEGRTIYGEQPFGEGLIKWTQLAPGFHLDRVHTPLMITAINKGSLLAEWEIYASLYRQHKPVDLIWIPNGQHILQKPAERLASQQMTVDWLRFWLQDYERANPDDPKQYARWREMRRTQEQENKNRVRRSQ
jgi:Prolyl oligopeptidase family